MSKIAELFHSLDKFVFTQVDNVKASGAYMKVSEEISALDEKVKTTLNLGVTFILILAPVVITLVFVYSNLNLKESVDYKKEIFSLSDVIVAGKKNLTLATAGALSTIPIATKEMLQNKLRNIMNGQNIPLTGIVVETFESDTSIPGVLKAKAKIKLNKLTTIHLSQLIKSLKKQDNFFVESTSIQTNKKEKLLDGSIEIFHLSKARN